MPQCLVVDVLITLQCICTIKLALYQESIPLFPTACTDGDPMQSPII